MFDGEGGATASTSAEGGVESTAEPTVVYGKAEAGEETGQDGTDTQTEGTEEVDLDAEFDELIRGRYKQQYGNRVKDAIDTRFKNSADFEAQLRAYEEATAPLAMLYGLKTGDIEGLKEAIEKNDGLYAQHAEEQGVTVEQFRENLQLRADAQKGRDMLAEFKRQQEQRAMFQKWDSEAVELAETFPSFNLNSELENPDFVDALNRIGNVRDAFMVTHMGDILSGAMEMSAQQAQSKAVEQFKAKASRPVENGLSNNPAVVRKDDPSKMTDEDLFAVAERARAGERIRF